MNARKRKRKAKAPVKNRRRRTGKGVKGLFAGLFTALFSGPSKAAKRTPARRRSSFKPTTAHGRSRPDGAASFERFRASRPDLIPPTEEHPTPGRRESMPLPQMARYDESGGVPEEFTCPERDRFGRRLTREERRSIDLRDSGYRGAIDHDGNMGDED
jgi:hypothetical protein